MTPLKKEQSTVYYYYFNIQGVFLAAGRFNHLWLFAYLITMDMIMLDKT